jgi:hypothetical protein
MKTNIIIAVLLVMVSAASAQNYTSVADGSWTNAADWNNTSGWGTSTPPIDGSQGSGTITMKNNMTISSAYNIGSATMNISAGKTLTVNGNMTLGGGSSVNVSGTLTINGDLTLNSTLTILPGGVVNVNGNVIVNNSNNLIVGTSTNPPPYADLIIKSDLKQNNSGDVTLNKNARVAVFGNVVDDGSGGTKLTLNSGAEMYVDGKVKFTGGGDDITNNNTLNPYGLYVNGTTSNSGGGSSTTSNEGNRTTMQTTNPTFYSWVNSQQNLMPVTLIYFDVDKVSEEGISLKWATASEENFDHFIVESSINGKDFTEIANVNSDPSHNYNYLVVNPVVGKSYYRLKTVDLDGTTETFKVVSATFESTKSVAVFPNPVVDSKLNINFNFDPAEDVTVSITNLNGMEVTRLQVNGTENMLMLSLDAGIYILKITSFEVSKAMRIVIK